MLSVVILKSFFGDFWKKYSLVIFIRHISSNIFLKWCNLMKVLCDKYKNLLYYLPVFGVRFYFILIGNQIFTFTTSISGLSQAEIFVGLPPTSGGTRAQSHCQGSINQMGGNNVYIKQLLSNYETTLKKSRKTFIQTVNGKRPPQFFLLPWKFCFFPWKTRKKCRRK